MEPIYHPELLKKIKNIGNENIIFFGKSFSGKENLAMECLRIKSPSKLRYDKSIMVTFNKRDYAVKLSDIHFEIDILLLGNSGRMVWHAIHTQICDIVRSRSKKHGIVLIKNFHACMSDMCDVMSQYIKMGDKDCMLQYFIITECISFMPSHLVNLCKIVRVPKGCDILTLPYENIIINNVTNNIFSFKTSKIVTLRNSLYDILIYGMQPHNIMWNIIKKMQNTLEIKEKCLLKICSIFKEYEYNYRPIIHLERFSLYIIDQLRSKQRLDSCVGDESESEDILSKISSK